MATISWIREWILKSISHQQKRIISMDTGCHFLNGYTLWKKNPLLKQVQKNINNSKIKTLIITSIHPSLWVAEWVGWELEVQLGIFKLPSHFLISTALTTLGFSI